MICFERSIFIPVVEVEVEQPRGFVGILFVEWHEAIAEVEGYGCGITLQLLVVVEATAEAVVLCLAVEVRNGYAVVGEAEERFDMFIGLVVSLFQHISHGQLLLAVKRAFVEDKVI